MLMRDVEVSPMTELSFLMSMRSRPRLWGKTGLLAAPPGTVPV